MEKWYIVIESIKKGCQWLLSNTWAVLIIIVLVASLLIYQQGHTRGYDSGYQIGYSQGLIDMVPDTTIDTATVPVDTSCAPAEIDSTVTPAIITAFKSMSRGGFVKVTHTSGSAMMTFEIKEPAPVYITKTKIVNNDKPVLDWQKGCLAGTAGVVVGAVVTGALTVFLLSR